jgi:hypothetical protein
MRHAVLGHENHRSIRLLIAGVLLAIPGQLAPCQTCPLQTVAVPDGDTGTTPLRDVEGVSLFTAIEEQLGLKLVPTRGPGQVLVIDHIEHPSENQLFSTIPKYGAFGSFDVLSFK